MGRRVTTGSQLVRIAPIILSVPERTRVVIAEDDLLVREGVVSLLTRRGYDVVGQCGDPADLITLVTVEKPDVAVVDVRMPPTYTTEGLDAARVICDESPATAILVLSAHVELEEATDLIAGGGGRGYLLKSRDPGHILHAVRLAAEGDMVFDPDLAPAIAAGLSQGPADQGPVKLTAREQEILQMLPSGRTNREIAVALRRSPDTIKGHLERIFRKLGAQDRTAAVAEAFRRGLLH